MAKHWWLPLAILCAGAVAVWPLREHLTAAEIAARSPRETWLAALFLLALYTLKGLSVAFPLSVLEAAGGLLFPFPLALAVNLAGVMAAQTAPYLLGRRRQESSLPAIWSASTWAPPASPGARISPAGCWGAFPGCLPPRCWAPRCGSSAPPASSSLCSPAPR